MGTNQYPTPAQPVYVIAEAGVNHNGDIGRAMELIDVAADAGADAVKFQTFITDELVVIDAPKARYQEGVSSGQTQHEMLLELELPFEAFKQLKRRCEERKIDFLSTPFESRSADFLDAIGMSAFKVPSGELTNLPFITHIAKKGKPVLLSTGMATIGEVEAAVRTIEDAGNRSLTILHCVSSYPAEPFDVNLRAMETLRSAFGYPVGFSDHTLGVEIAIAAVALGAVVLEKHFTTDKTLRGPDHKASLDPVELTHMVSAIRRVTSSIGDGIKRPAPCELDTASVARKSLFLSRDVEAGEILDARNITVRRPGTGLPPAMVQQIYGRRAARKLTQATPLLWEDIV